MITQAKDQRSVDLFMILDFWSSGEEKGESADSGEILNSPLRLEQKYALTKK